MESLECERRSSAEKKHFLREIKELEVKRDNMISNANLKGKILDSLGSKEAIKTQIKVRSIVPKFLVPIIVKRNNMISNLFLISSL